MLDVFFFATLFLTLFYLLAGINKLIHFNSTVKSFAKKIPTFSLLSTLSIVLVILIEILAPIAMIYSILSPGKQIYGLAGSNTLIGFTVLATLLYHFPPTKKEHQMPFLRNLAFIGGFLLYNHSL